MVWGFWIFGTLITGFALVYLFRPETQVLSLYGFIALNSGLVLASVSLTRAWRDSREQWQRPIWLGLAVGLWFWLAAGVMEIIQYFIDKPSYGSYAAFFWVTGYLPMFAGLFPQFRTSPQAGRKRTTILLLLFLAAGYIAVFHSYLWPQLADPSRELSSKVVDVLYSSFNFLLLGMILDIYRNTPHADSTFRMAFRELTAAMIIMIAADIGLSYFTDPESVMYQLLDIPYFLIYFLFFLAGLNRP
jgi:hypothetical protein